MKKLFRVPEYANNIDAAILLARIGIAALMLTHGLPKLGMFVSGEPIQFPPVFGMSPDLSLILTVFAEVVCSVFILIGLGTRLAVIPLIATMLVAVLYIHGADPFSNREPGLYFLLVYALLFLTGSGKYSVDYYLQHKESAISYQR